MLYEVITQLVEMAGIVETGQIIGHHQLAHPLVVAGVIDGNGRKIGHRLQKRQIVICKTALATGIDQLNHPQHAIADLERHTQD